MINISALGRLDVPFIMGILEVLAEKVDVNNGKVEILYDQIQALQVLAQIKENKSDMDDKALLVALLISAGAEMVKLQKQIDAMSGPHLH